MLCRHGKNNQPKVKLSPPSQEPQTRLQTLIDSGRAIFAPTPRPAKNNSRQREPDFPCPVFLGIWWGSTVEKMSSSTSHCTAAHALCSFACSLQGRSILLPREGGGVVRCVYHKHTQSSGLITARRADSSLSHLQVQQKINNKVLNQTIFLVVALLGVRRSPAAAFSSSL